jgi:hypothetical protein
MMPAEAETEVELQRTDQHVETDNAVQHGFVLLAIFVAAVAIRLWFNFAADHANCAGCCDASEYVRNAAALSGVLSFPAEFWHKFFLCVFGSASAVDLESVRSALSGLKEVYQAGPVFPIFLTVSVSAVGFLFSNNPLGATVLVQSILSALACCLIADFTSRAWTRTVGYVAGFIAAIYPGFIINSGRLYTESFATFLVCLMLALVVRGFFTSKNVIPRAMAIGLLSACLQLTRSILVITSIWMIPILYAQQRQARWKSSIAALLLGFACVVIPWVTFQHVAFNKGGMVVDRVGNYNLFIGSNTQTQGWLTFPYPDGRGIENKTLPNLLLESVKTSPSRFVRLMLDKPARLFQLPWNDFRTNIGVFDSGSQSFLHQLVILFAALGLMVALFTSPSKESPSKQQLYSRLLLLGFVSIHLVYALFITVPRYAVTAMPCVIAFSAAGIVFLIGLLASAKTRSAAGLVCVSTFALWWALHCNLVQMMMDWGVFNNATLALAVQSAVKLCLLLIWFVTIWATFGDTSGYRRLSRVISVGCLLIVIPLVVLPGRASGRWYEWQRPLGQGPISQTISLPDQFGAQQTYLMVDADGARSLFDAEITVNGKTLTGPVIPGLALAQDYSILQHEANGNVSWEGENIFNFMTRPADLSNSELRQWFFIPVPKQITAAAAGPLQIVLRKSSMGSDGVIFGSYKHSNQIKIPSATVYSWEKAFYGVENDHGLSDPRLDDSVSVASAAIAANSKTSTESTIPSNFKPSTTTTAASVTAGGSSSAAVTSPAAEPNIRLLVPAAPANKQSVKLLKRVLVKDLELTAQNIASPFIIYSVPAFSKNDLWVVRTTGMIKSLNSTARPTVTLQAVCGKAPCRYESPWTPNHCLTGKRWRRFEVTVPIAPGQLPGGIKQLQGEFVFDNPKWKTAHYLPTDAVQLKDLRIDIIKLPGNPLARGFSIH